MAVTVQPTAQVDDSAELGDGTVVWELAQIREGARLGTGCIVGRGAYVGSGVRMGNSVKLQNYALIYEPAELGDGVFVGPAVVLTNDRNPRSVDPSGRLKRGERLARGGGAGCRGRITRVRDRSAWHRCGSAAGPWWRPVRS